jgi:hypothetical protein
VPVGFDLYSKAYTGADAANAKRLASSNVVDISRSMDAEKLRTQVNAQYRAKSPVLRTFFEISRLNSGAGQSEGGPCLF